MKKYKEYKNIEKKKVFNKATEIFNKKGIIDYDWEHKNHYVYSYINIKDNSIFYIGQGMNGRLFDINSRTSKFKNYIKDNNYTVCILEDKLYELEALYLEALLINSFGKEILLNKQYPNIKNITRLLPKEDINKINLIYKDILHNQHYKYVF